MNYPDIIQQVPPVLYEDNHILIVNKPAGVPTQRDQSRDMALVDILKKYLVDKHQKAGNAFLGIVHRIDRPVSGLLMYAKTSKALDRLTEMFRRREIEKTYWAVVRNAPPQPEAELVHWLIKNTATNISRAYKEERPLTKRCELSYSTLLRLDNYYLLEVKPKTGRHHQIRVQLSTIGCSIKGDVKYGARRPNADGRSIHLHARRLQFIHPIKKEPIDITAPPPDDPIWNEIMRRLS